MLHIETHRAKTAPHFVDNSTTSKIPNELPTAGAMVVSWAWKQWNWRLNRTDVSLFSHTLETIDVYGFLSRLWPKWSPDLPPGAKWASCWQLIASVAKGLRLLETLACSLNRKQLDFSYELKNPKELNTGTTQTQPTWQKQVESLLFPCHFDNRNSMWWHWINIENWLDLQKIINIWAFFFLSPNF